MKDYRRSGNIERKGMVNTNLTSMKFVGKSQNRAPPKRGVGLNWRSGILEIEMKFLELTVETKGNSRDIYEVF